MELTMILHAIGGAMMLSGAFFVLVGSFGLWRLPEFFTRLHPASISDSLGLPLLLAGVLLQSPYGTFSFKLLLLAAFALITSATATHALSQAALLSGLKPLGGVEPEAPVKHAAPKKKAVKKVTRKKPAAKRTRKKA